MQIGLHHHHVKGLEVAGFSYRVRVPFNELVSGKDLEPAVLAKLDLAHLAGMEVGVEIWAYRDGESTFLTTHPEIQSSRNIDLTWIGLQEQVAIGWNSKRRPVAGELEKRRMLRGIPLVDLTGYRWNLPVIAEHSPECSLPTFVSFRKGALYRGVLPRWRHLSELATGLTDHIGANGFDMVWAFETLIRILTINYRVSKLELEAFGEMDVCHFDFDTCVAGLVCSLGLRELELTQ